MNAFHAAIPAGVNALMAAAETGDEESRGRGHSREEKSATSAAGNVGINQTSPATSGGIAN